MKRPPFLVTIFVAIASVVLFSGQQQRPFAQPQQRQPAPPVQRQTAPVAPPRPVAVPSTETPVAEMPSLFWLPEDVQFPEMPPGAPRTATLIGDPRAGGLYVTRTFIPKGKQIIPHTHSDSRTVVVLSGTYYYGLGETFDESRMVALPPGSFFTEPAGVPHFTWAKESDVIIQTTAIGPSGTQIVPNRPSSPGNTAVSPSRR